MSYKAFDEFADQAITMGRISLIAVLGGRYWPYCGSTSPLLLRYRSLEKPCGHLPIGEIRFRLVDLLDFTAGTDDLDCHEGGRTK